MKCFILCGGLGTRLSEETNLIPKPMIKIGNKPILEHIMDIYSKYGFYEFVLCGGYKINKIKDHFLKKQRNNSDIFIDFNMSQINLINQKINKRWKIWIFDTGLKSQTAHRLYRLRKLLKDEEDFFMTYGDGLSNVNIKKLLNFHKRKKKIATMTIVRPQARFGHIELQGDKITKFREKDQTAEGWINGFFIVLNQKVLENINSKKQLIFEREPLEKLSKKKELNAFKHNSFWHPMDTLRDKRFLEKVFKGTKSPWLLK